MQGRGGGLDTCPTLFVSHWELTQRRLMSHWVLLLGQNYLSRLEILSCENIHAIPLQSPPRSRAVSSMERCSPWGKSKPQGRWLFSHRPGKIPAPLFNLSHFPEWCRDPGTTLCHSASDIKESKKLHIFKRLEHTSPPHMI